MITEELSGIFMFDPNCSNIEYIILKAKGSGAGARAEGPFLQWQNRSGEAAKAPRETPAPPPSRVGKGELPTSGSSD